MTKIGSSEHAISPSEDAVVTPTEKGTIFTDDFSKETYENTYKFGDEDINGTQLRVAKDLASIEKDPELWTKKFLSVLENFKFVPGGRITSNAGTGLKGTTYINCFVPNTQVLTDKGYKAIVDVEIGDMVFTHKGRFKPVVSLMKKEHNDKLVSFNSSFATNPINTTREHPFYCGSDKWIEADFASDLVFVKSNKPKDLITIDLYDYVKDVKRKSTNKRSIIADESYVYSTSEWTNPNGGQITSRNKSKTKRFISVDESFAYFVGRYVGDGCVFSVNNDYDVDGFNLIFHTKEIDSQIALKTIIDEAFEIETNINKSNQFDASYIRKNNIVVANFLNNTCGRYSETKRIPDFIWNSSDEVCASFIKGLLDADGTITSKETKITLNNELLINDLQALLFMCGIPSNKQNELVDGKPYFRLSLVREYAFKLLKTSQKVYSDNRILEYCEEPKIQSTSQYKSKIKKLNNSIDGYVFATEIVNDKVEIPYKGFVYNISVLEDESYIVNNVIVHNCFVDGFIGEDQDSMDSIMQALHRQASILKSEGGYGFCADTMRPRGAFIRGIGNNSPGSTKMLEMWDKQSEVITEGSGKKSDRKEAKVKIRKGAQMVTQSCWHPDIEEFIAAKQTSGRLTKFNMSILITNDFMHAVKNNLRWDLEFPNYESHTKEYKKHWDGNLKAWKAKGYPTQIYKTFENANELWEKIMQSTYNRNEPGVLFVDTMNELNNLYYCEYISATNPCISKDTLISTPQGEIRVEDLVNNREKYKEIYSYNVENKVVQVDIIENVFLTREKANIIELELENGEKIKLTPEHKVFTKNRGWVEAIQLTEEDVLLRLD